MKTDEIFNALLEDIIANKRHTVKEPDGTYREETDVEFRNRVIEKYRKSEEE